MNLLRAIRPLDYVLATAMVALTYAVARFAGNRDNQIIGLVGILALQIVTLRMDSSTGGLGALLLSVPAAVIFYALQRRPLP